MELTMTTYYKAVRPDGTDFYTGTVQWAPPAGHKGDWVVRHPTATKVGGDASEYLSVSTMPTACIGMEWPCRLLTVETVSDVIRPPQPLPHKRAGVAFRVTGELPAHEALGPQGEYVAALLERARHLTPDEARAITPVRAARWNAAEDSARRAAWNAARVAARVAARSAVWGAARSAARGPAGSAAGDAAGVLVVRGLITADKYETLSGPWRTVIGPIHPDDPELPSDRNTA